MIIDAAEFDLFKCRLIGWLLDLPQLTNVDAAEQILRSRIHPELYASAQRLQGIMQTHGPRFVRRVAERVGTQDIVRVFPQTAPYMQAYTQAAQDPQLLAQVFRDLAVLTAIVDKPFLEKLSAATVLYAVVNTLLERFEQQRGQHISTQQFWNIFTKLKRSESIPPSDVAPDTHPVVVRVHDGEPFRVDTHIRMVDALRHAYHVELQKPVVLRQQNVDHVITIPLVRVQDHGITVDIAFEYAYERFTEPVRCRVSSQDLAAIGANGSAVSATIGRTGDIRLFTEDIEPFPGESHPIPSSHVASIRVTPNVVEITRLDRSTRLTVFA